MINKLLLQRIRLKTKWLQMLFMEVFTKHFIYYDIIDVQNQIKQHFTQEQINADARLNTIVGYGPRKYYEAGD